MKRSRLWILVAWLFVACGGDDGAGPGDGGNNNPPDPVPTAAGAPDGTPVSGTIGAAGGSLTSPDGLFSLIVPPAALAVDTEITIQPITNTAWGGVGAGYRLTPDGLAFAVPVDLEFSLEDSLLAGSDTSVVDVAVQRDDGTWGVLKNRSLDWDNRTLTCTTTHFSDYSMTEGVQIRPAAALVFVNQTRSLVVRFCSRLPIPGDPELASLLIECDEELAPLGTFTNWSVNGVVGGNSTVGRVAPTSGQQVTYTAPATEPNPNTVAVSVSTRYQGMTALLVANITIGGTNWDGEITAEYSNGDRAHALLTWEFIGQFGTQQFYKPVGPVEYTLGAGDCAFVSLSPNASVFAGTEGLMTIDYGVDPPSVNMTFGTYWTANHCYQCPDHPVQCAEIELIPAFSVNDVVIGANLDLIEALGVPEDQVIYTYTFTKVVP